MQVADFFHAVAESLSIGLFVGTDLLFHGIVISYSSFPLGEWSSVSNPPLSLANASLDILERYGETETTHIQIKCLDWNASGNLLASCGSDRTVRIWNSQRSYVLKPVSSFPRNAKTPSPFQIISVRSSGVPLPRTSSRVPSTRSM